MQPHGSAAAYAASITPAPDVTKTESAVDKTPRLTSASKKKSRGKRQARAMALTSMKPKEDDEIRM